MFYKFIDLPNLPQIQTDVLNFVNSKEFALDPNEPHSIRLADSWQHIQSIVNAVETICAWQHVNYIAFAITPARIVNGPPLWWQLPPHRDSLSDDEEYPWALNIPIAGCQESYVNFYHLKKEAIGNTSIRSIHSQGENRYTSNSFEEQDLELVETLCLDRPAFFNTREIHLPVNDTSTPRHIITVRFHVDFRKYNLGLV